MLTLVTATVMDPAGQVFAYGTYRFSFWMPSGYQPSQANWPDGDIPMVIVGQMDAGGSFAVEVPDNLTITPVGSQWRVMVAPFATAPSTELNILITGETQDISGAINASVPLIQVPIDPAPVARPLARAYLDAEVFEPISGAIYFNINDSCIHYFDGMNWRGLCGSTISVTTSPPLGGVQIALLSALDGSIGGLTSSSWPGGAGLNAFILTAAGGTTGGLSGMTWA